MAKILIFSVDSKTLKLVLLRMFVHIAYYVYWYSVFKNACNPSALPTAEFTKTFQHQTCIIQMKFSTTKQKH